MARTKSGARIYFVRPVPKSSRDLRSRKHVPKQGSSEHCSKPMNPQSKSSLFRLPPEVRSLIFEFALTFYEKCSSRVCCEPLSLLQTRSLHHTSCTRSRGCSIALLRTCQLVYAETCCLAPAINVHVLSSWGMRYPCAKGHRDYFERMTPKQLEAVKTIQIVTSSQCLIAKDPDIHAVNGPLARLASLRYKYVGENIKSLRDLRCIDGPFPQELTLTLQHGGWRTWFTNRPSYDLAGWLENHHWRNVFGGLRKLRMELEIQEADRWRIDPLIERLKAYSFDIGDHQILRPQDSLSETVWTGKLFYVEVEGGPLVDHQVTLYTVTISWLYSESANQSETNQQFETYQAQAPLDVSPLGYITVRKDS